MGVPVLWQFKCSHFCEKARWTLAFKRIEGRTLRDSTRIIEHVEAAHPEMPVHPGDANERKRAAELENFFDGLGSALRCVHYSLLLPDLEEAAAFFANAAAGPGFRLFRLTFATLFRPMMNRHLGLDAERFGTPAPAI